MWGSESEEGADNDDHTGDERDKGKAEDGGAP